MIASLWLGVALTDDTKSYERVLIVTSLGVSIQWGQVDVLVWEGQTLDEIKLRLAVRLVMLWHHRWSDYDIESLGMVWSTACQRSARRGDDTHTLGARRRLGTVVDCKSVESETLDVSSGVDWYVPEGGVAIRRMTVTHMGHIYDVGCYGVHALEGGCAVRKRIFKKRTKKKAKSKQNRARNGKDKVKSQPGGRKYKILVSLISLNRGSFDVIVGMDWLSKRKFVIVCHEKVVRIPLEGDEILRVHGERTQGVVDNLRGTQATPVAKSPYRLAPLEMQELSEQLRELQDKDKILATPSEMSKVENAPAEMLRDLDQQMEKRADDDNSKEWNSGDDQLRLRWMIYLVVLADAAKSVRDTIGFEYFLASSSGWTK
ncbi:hypothetical protein Tco_1123490 [Tanacetum coccineum]|uniref:Uncharacterized protein n=1 Tax=Tanacetum coccineum TaxID=301880 RepID=A0ABQ5J4Y7_9ASTR